MDLDEKTVLSQKLHMDIFWVVETEGRTRKYIRHTPIRHLHPSDSEKHLFGNMKRWADAKMTPLLLKIIECDNAVAFAHVLKRFGLTVRKKKCEGLLRKVVFANSIRIMAKLIEMGVDIRQGDHLALRCARREGKADITAFLCACGGDVGLERSVEKFCAAERTPRI